MPKSGNRSNAAALAALASAVVVGAGWAFDAWRRDRFTRTMHRTLVDLLLNALTADDPVTARHSRRVADLAYALAETCRLPREEMATLRVAALLHDLGKIDDRFFFIIHSRKPLSPEQRHQMKFHPDESAHILEPLEKLHPGILAMVSSHHECWDGSGYPRGLAGDDIPLGARVIALADAFDAMTQPRQYKEDPMSVEEALDTLYRGSGKQFDPGLVRRVDCEPVLTQWLGIARHGLDDERQHLAHPNPTEAVLAAAGD